MRPSRVLRTLAVGLLSLGFLGQFPFSEGNRRHISSCGDTVSDPQAPVSSLPPFPGGLFSFVQNDAVRQAAEAYSLFFRQLQVDASLRSFSAPSIFGIAVPSFPSYAIPDVSKYQVDLTKPDTSHLMWAGLGADPQLQYLVRPLSTPAAKAPGSGLDGLINLAKVDTAGTVNLTPGPAAAAAVTATRLPSGPDLSAGGKFEVSKF